LEFVLVDPNLEFFLPLGDGDLESLLLESLEFFLPLGVDDLELLLLESLEFFLPLGEDDLESLLVESLEFFLPLGDGDRESFLLESLEFFLPLREGDRESLLVDPSLEFFVPFGEGDRESLLFENREPRLVPGELSLESFPPSRDVLLVPGEGLLLSTDFFLPNAPRDCLREEELLLSPDELLPKEARPLPLPLGVGLRLSLDDGVYDPPNLDLPFFPFGDALLLLVVDRRPRDANRDPLFAGLFEARLLCGDALRDFFPNIPPLLLRRVLALGLPLDLLLPNLPLLGLSDSDLLGDLLLFLPRFPFPFNLDTGLGLLESSLESLDFDPNFEEDLDFLPNKFPMNPTDDFFLPFELPLLLLLAFDCDLDLPALLMVASPPPGFFFFCLPRFGGDGDLSSLMDGGMFLVGGRSNVGSLRFLPTPPLRSFESLRPNEFCLSKSLLSLAFLAAMSERSISEILLPPCCFLGRLFDLFRWFGWTWLRLGLRNDVPMTYCLSF
jgi:hypothetical protein